MPTGAESPISNAEIREVFMGIGGRLDALEEKLKIQGTEGVERNSRRESFHTAGERSSISVEELSPLKETTEFLAKLEKSSQRRNTVLPVPQESRNNLGEYPLVIVPYEIKEEDKIRKITVKSIMRLLDTYAQYLNQAADTRKLMVAWLSKSALESLINDQIKKRLEDRGDLDMISIQSWSNKKLYRALAEFVRPRSLLEYQNAL